MTFPNRPGYTIREAPRKGPAVSLQSRQLALVPEPSTVHPFPSHSIIQTQLRNVVDQLEHEEMMCNHQPHTKMQAGAIASIHHRLKKRDHGERCLFAMLEPLVDESSAAVRGVDDLELQRISSQLQALEAQLDVGLKTVFDSNPVKEERSRSLPPKAVKVMESLSHQQKESLEGQLELVQLIGEVFKGKVQRSLCQLNQASHDVLRINYFGRLLKASCHSSGTGSAATKRLPISKEAKKMLMKWFEDHFHHPYPSDDDKAMLATQTSITTEQVNNWFINTRVRVWKPRMKQIVAENDAGNGARFTELMSRIQAPYVKSLPSASEE